MNFDKVLDFLNTSYIRCEFLSKYTSVVIPITGETSRQTVVKAIESYRIFRYNHENRPKRFGEVGFQNVFSDEGGRVAAIAGIAVPDQTEQVSLMLERRQTHLNPRSLRRRSLYYEKGAPIIMSGYSFFLRK